jgi:superfamily II DNA/RNA helicase
MLKRIPYVIDNDKHKLGDVLNQVLAEHAELAMDVATAYFNIQGYAVLADGLKTVGSLRLLLGAEPDGSMQIGVMPDSTALKAALRGDLSQEPYSQKTLDLVEDLTRFIRDGRVQVRLFDKKFLHAKCYLFYGDPHGGPLFERFRPVLGVVGSSNFTGPGLMRNRELNLVHKGIMPEDEVVDERGRRAALSHYTQERSLALRADTDVPDEHGVYDGGQVPRVSNRISFESRRVIKGEVGAAAMWELAEWFDDHWQQSVEFKDQLLDLLDTSKFGAMQYTPYQVYIKALYEYYRGELGEDAEVSSNLYSLNLAEFQGDAVKRAKRILSQYDGVMICDSTGLGKTWIGLQILLEYAYHKRWHALVVCPASLKGMWETRLHQTKIQAKVISQEALGRDDVDIDAYGNYDVVVVDECHNFRSKDSARYDNLTRILALNGNRGEHGYRKKVALLTATPINNSLMDLYQQLQLMTMGDNAFFAAAGIGRLDKYFYEARRQILADGGSASRILSNLLDQVMIRRTRQFIKQAYPDATIDGKKVHFPQRKLLTVNYDLEGTYAGIYTKVVRGIEVLQLAPYDLETYKADPAQQDPLQIGRGQALVGIFKSRYLKRLESSVAAFRISVFRLMEYMLTFRHYIQADVLLEPVDFWKLLSTIDKELEDDALQQEEDVEEEEFGKHPTSRHKQIEASKKAKAILKLAKRPAPGTYNLQMLNDALDADLGTLNEIYSLVRPIKPEEDRKLSRLKELLSTELKGKKVLVFSSYMDTANYLHKQVTGDAALMTAMGDRTIRVIHGGTDLDTRRRIVQGFAPKSNDKPEWAGTEHEIDLVFSTDVLSEGQNLQDCAHLVNYDLHWNPTRMIQRAGRIDRIGTDFDVLFIHNFFPDAGLEQLLGLVQSLQTKIRQIDTAIGLDASVLGEAINPKVFNTLKRIQGEDDAVIDEEEAEAELSSDEALVRQLAEFIKATGTAALREIPDGIHSGLHKKGINGAFFYYQRRGTNGRRTDHFWRFYNAKTRDILDNRLALAEMIRCQPDTPRVVDPSLKADVLKIMEDVENHIVASTAQKSGAQAAPKELSGEQSAVLLALQQLMAAPGVDRKRVMALVGQLASPLPKAPVKDLKQAHGAFQKTNDAAAFLTAAETVASKYAQQPVTSTASNGEAGATALLKREDLHLICFDFLS